MKSLILTLALVLALSSVAVAAVPLNPGPALTRAEHMAQIYRVPAGETFQQSGDGATGDSGTSSAAAE